MEETPMTDRDDKPSPRLPDPPATTAIAGSRVDVQKGGIGDGPGYSGQEYDGNDFAAVRAMKASSEGPDEAAAPNDDRLPPDNGQRAFFDEKTGAVHGSGAGAGGGNPGEDFASDAAAGDGYPQTGRGSRSNGKDAQDGGR
jgi:hypothetical protein